MTGAPVAGPPPKPNPSVALPAVLALAGGPAGFIAMGILTELGAHSAATAALYAGALVSIFCAVWVLASAVRRRVRRPVHPTVEPEPAIRIAGLPPGIGVRCASRGDANPSVVLALVGLFILLLPVLLVLLLYLTGNVA